MAQKYKVKMPVLTAVARIIDNELTPQKAVLELMGLPQVTLNSLILIELITRKFMTLIRLLESSFKLHLGGRGLKPWGSKGTKH